MMRYKLPLIGFLFTLVGCTDNIDTLTREYRNTINESIDALMMITDERSAKRIQVLVLDNMSPRFKEIDRKLEIVVANRTKAEIVKDVFESDGFQLYLTDLTMNRQRLAVETTRLRDVFNKLKKVERDRLDEEGLFDEEPDMTKICPTLVELVDKEGKIDELRNQILQPKLLQKVANFPNMKVNNYDALFQKFLERRKKSFVSDNDVEIVH